MATPLAARGPVRERPGAHASMAVRRAPVARRPERAGAVLRGAGPRRQAAVRSISYSGSRQFACMHASCRICRGVAADPLPSPSGQQPTQRRGGAASARTSVDHRRTERVSRSRRRRRRSGQCRRTAATASSSASASSPGLSSAAENFFRGE